MDENTLLTKLEDLTEKVRRSLLENSKDNEFLKGKCAYAATEILIASKRSEYNSLKLNGKFEVIGTYVYIEPWSIHSEPQYHHYIVKYRNSIGNYILDPTIDQFPFLRTQSNSTKFIEGYVFKENEYPTHLVRELEVNPKEFYDYYGLQGFVN